MSENTKNCAGPEMVQYDTQASAVLLFMHDLLTNEESIVHDGRMTDEMLDAIEIAITALEHQLLNPFGKQTMCTIIAGHYLGVAPVTTFIEGMLSTINLQFNNFYSEHKDIFARTANLNKEHPCLTQLLASGLEPIAKQILKKEITQNEEDANGNPYIDLTETVISVLEVWANILRPYVIYELTETASADADTDASPFAAPEN